MKNFCSICIKISQYALNPYLKLCYLISKKKIMNNFLGLIKTLKIDKNNVIFYFDRNLTNFNLIASNIQFFI
ncbi:hypothetical protein BpHYR1_010981 [Brachionus plicatilis]|uniref:Uncharacterized protein n=1 Tax=Brachionus plicatilis TaxID=10195 RepID=A0A3M7T0W8_BRAPC|nr:hypothetical protein BpHYR1_010981 [Brachionus plicatilis]